MITTIKVNSQFSAES